MAFVLQVVFLDIQPDVWQLGGSTLIIGATLVSAYRTALQTKDNATPSDEPSVGDPEEDARLLRPSEVMGLGGPVSDHESR